MKKRLAIVVGEGERERAKEAMRAAVGLTLRGDAITVVHAPGAELDARARATLEMFGHRVAGIEALGEALDAEVIEIWGRVAPEGVAPGPVTPVQGRTLLHVVRTGSQAAAVAPGERVVHLDGLDDDQLLDLVLAAGAVAVW